MDKSKLRLLFIGVIIVALLLAAVVFASSLESQSESSPRPVATSTPSAIKSPQKPINYSGKIRSISFDKAKYFAGDTVKAEMKVKNNGKNNITSEKIVIKVKCVKLNSFGGNMVLKGLDEEEKTRSYEMRFSEVILPNETKTLTSSFKTPKEMSGVSLAGEYDLSLTLNVNGYSVDSKKMDLVLY